MIEVIGLTKHYGKTVAVDDLSFTVRPGAVTGFLGPNGSGKSTTMRLILGLDNPTKGSTTVAGQQYAHLTKPLTQVGALLDANWIHPNRSARSHLRFMAASNKIPVSRVDEVLEIVGLSSVAKRAAGKFSLGMKQRLGLAGALLGDPKVLLFDEPVNGLDPEGIRWIRELVRGLAGRLLRKQLQRCVGGYGATLHIDGEIAKLALEEEVAGTGGVGHELPKLVVVEARLVLDVDLQGGAAVGGLAALDVDDIQPTLRFEKAEAGASGVGDELPELIVGLGLVRRVHLQVDDGAGLHPRIDDAARV